MRPFPVLAEPFGELCGGGGFARTLQADDQHDAGRFVGEAQFGFVAAQDFDQLIFHDGDHLLSGGEGGEHFLAHRLDLHVFD